MSAGMLMVLMDPPAGLEAEFQDWYDFEHAPERARIPGFHTASRWVCVEGWPRYMACYDLETVGVLDEEPYRAISGDNFSPWSKRILPRALGRQRLALEQVGPAVGHTREDSHGLVLLRFRGRRAESLERAVTVLAVPSVCQTRIFVTAAAAPEESAIIVDAPATALVPAWSAAELADALGPEARHLLGVWRYTRYMRTSM
jgi:hypothetical protein